jgi:hypothetical protein
MFKRLTNIFKKKTSPTHPQPQTRHQSPTPQPPTRHQPTPQPLHSTLSKEPTHKPFILNSLPPEPTHDVIIQDKILKKSEINYRNNCFEALYNDTVSLDDGKKTLTTKQINSLKHMYNEYKNFNEYENFLQEKYKKMKTINPKDINKKIKQHVLRAKTVILGLYGGKSKSASSSFSVNFSFKKTRKHKTKTKYSLKRVVHKHKNKTHKNKK